MGNASSTGAPVSAEAEEAAEEARREEEIRADTSLTPAEQAAKMHVLPRKHRGRRWKDFFEPLPDGFLGRGHYGEVRLVRRIADGKEFAMKTIEKRKPIYVEILRSEVEIGAGTDHPGIIKLVDRFEEGSHLYLIFETCLGGELFEPIADSSVTLSERQSARIIRKVMEAVRYLHDNGIVHRDLKPENILLKDRGIDSELKVIDFGLATHIKPGERLHRHVGTPYYIAPEVLRRSYDHGADIWSIGVILYTLLCSAPPFFGDTERDIYNSIRSRRVMFDGPEWQNRSVLCRDLISQLLQRDPAARYSLDDALTFPWVVYEGDVSIDPAEPRTFARLFARLRRYGVFPLLKRLCMLHIATRLLETPTATERELCFFRTMDLDADGALSAHDLDGFLKSQGAELHLSEVEWIVEGLSMRKGAARAALLPELTAAVMPRLYYLRESALIHEFAFFDADSDGLITAPDLVRSAGISAHDAEEALADADLGQGPDCVDFGTFIRIMAGGERDAI